MTGDDVWKKLLEGNARFANNKMEHPRATPDYRNAIAADPHPQAIILSCADSRIPPEIVFDQGLGDLFTIRLAGNVASDGSLGSAEFGVRYLNIPLVVVLGHKSCLAVINACNGYDKNDHVRYLTRAIEPAVEKARKKEGDLYDNAIDENIKLVMDKLKHAEPILKDYYEKGKIKIIGARYDMDTGLVREVEY